MQAGVVPARQQGCNFCRGFGERSRRDRGPALFRFGIFRTLTGVSEDPSAAGALLTRAASIGRAFPAQAAGVEQASVSRPPLFASRGSVLAAGTVAEDAVVTLGALAAAGETGAELTAGVAADEVIGAGTAAATGAAAGGFTGGGDCDLLLFE